jgi:hypothetical protein
VFPGLFSSPVTCNRISRSEFHAAPEHHAKMFSQPHSPKHQPMDAESPQSPPPPVGKYEIELPKYRRPGEPEHYRLSATGLRPPKRESTATLVVSGIVIPGLHSQHFINVPGKQAFLVQDALYLCPCHWPFRPPPACSPPTSPPIDGGQLDWIMR